MQMLKEKAQLCYDIMKHFAPYMDHSNELYEKTEPMIEQFELLIESFRELDEEKKALLRTFMAMFSQYIDENEKAYHELKEAYAFLSGKTISLVEEYKASTGL